MIKIKIPKILQIIIAHVVNNFNKVQSKVSKLSNGDNIADLVLYFSDKTEGNGRCKIDTEEAYTLLLQINTELEELRDILQGSSEPIAALQELVDESD